MKKTFKILVQVLRSSSLSPAGLQEFDFEERRKRLILAFVSLIGLVLMCSLAVSDFLGGSLVEGTFEVLIAGWLFCVLSLLRTAKRVMVLFRVSLALLIFLVFQVLISDAGAQGSKLLWYFGFPPASSSSWGSGRESSGTEPFWPPRSSCSSIRTIFWGSILMKRTRS